MLRRNCCSCRLSLHVHVEDVLVVENEAYVYVPKLFTMRLMVVHQTCQRRFMQRRGEESNTGAYHALELDSMDYCRMYTARSMQTPRF